LIEDSGYLPVSSGSLYCTTYRPKDGPTGKRAAVLLLGAFAEERKSSTTAMVVMARAFARAGIPSARMDFRGCGDSSGSSQDLSFDTMIEDTAAACEALPAELGCEKIILAGVRLGASVAVMSAHVLAEKLRALVLMEPVVSGDLYARELARKQAIRRMLTKDAVKAETCGTDGVYDLDGIALDSCFMDSLSKVDLTAHVSEAGGELDLPALVLQIGARKKRRKDIVALRDALGSKARAEVLVTEPFWLQTDYVDPQSAVDAVMPFLRGTLED
jgi:pimeloyl-ACP methyl ester carboxylesterase